jgi:hypothetical protein
MRPRHYLFSDHVVLVQMQDGNGDVIAFFRPIERIRYQIGVGDVYGELHFLRNAGAGTVVRLTSRS